MRYLAVFTIFVLIACASASVKVFDTPEDQFEYAKKLFDQEKYVQATEAFQTVLYRFYGTSLADSVSYYTGMCYFEQEEYIVAVAEFKRLMINYPNSPLADDAHYMVAKCYFMDSPDNVGLEQDGVKDAIRTIENFFEDFPDSPYRSNARTLLDSCYARLAEKDFRNGEVYYRIGDLRAARIYLEEVVTKYSIPRWVGRALYRLAEIDFKQKDYENAKAKLNNFLNNFPRHEWAERATDKLQEVEKKLEETRLSRDDDTE
mgnify:CR=1 FL=1